MEVAKQQSRQEKEAAIKEHMTSLMKRLPNISPSMGELLKAKYSGLRIKELSNEPDFGNSVKILLARICAATGWRMPDNDFMRNALIKEFEAYCSESCKDMTLEEIPYAIRNYGLEIRDWGKDINLQLINAPISDYLAARKELSSFEEMKALEEPKTVGKEGEGWGAIWDKLKNGQYKGPFADLVPYSSLYDWLTETGQLIADNDQKWEWMTKAKEEYIRQIAFKKESFTATVEEKELCESMKVPTWGSNNKVRAALITPAKKIAVIELLNKIKQHAKD